MKEEDLFGLDRERRIVKAGVRDVFTPHRPISSEELFFGRQPEVQKLIEQVNTPGQHALLYGDRGVGKSSLARVAAELLLRHLLQGSRLFVSRCHSSTTFEDIIERPFVEAGGMRAATEDTDTHMEGGEAGLGIGPIKAGVDSHRTKSRKVVRPAQSANPSDAADLLASFPGLLVVDEADAIQDDDSRRQLAELIKLLSDAGSPFKLMVVGIAESGEYLTGAHPSVHRCLKETKLKRMSEKELAAIVEGGARILGLSFDGRVVREIAELSAGYPHFTQLLALKCAEEVVASDRTAVTAEDLARARRLAVEDAEGTLQRVFARATRSATTDMYERVLFSAAHLSGPEFTASQLRDRIERDTGQPITQGSLNNYFTRLVSDGEDTILRRVAQGVYRFNDPRMPSYVRIACRAQEA